MTIPATSLFIQHIRKFDDTCTEVVRLLLVGATVKLILVALSALRLLRDTIGTRPWLFFYRHNGYLSSRGIFDVTTLGPVDGHSMFQNVSMSAAIVSVFQRSPWNRCRIRVRRGLFW